MVRSFGESSVELQLRVWIPDARRRMDTVSQVIDRIKDRFDEKGIEIPYPKRDITIKKRSPKNERPLFYSNIALYKRSSAFFIF